MEKVYLLEHIHIITENNEDVKNIGIFSTRDKALQAIEKVKDQPGFNQCSELLSGDEEKEVSGFMISEETIDKVQWLEGYFTYNT